MPIQCPAHHSPKPLDALYICHTGWARVLIQKNKKDYFVANWSPRASCSFASWRKIRSAQLLDFLAHYNQLLSIPSRDQKRINSLYSVPGYMLCVWIHSLHTRERARWDRSYLATSSTWWRNPFSKTMQYEYPQHTMGYLGESDQGQWKREGRVLLTIAISVGDQSPYDMVRWDSSIRFVPKVPERKSLSALISNAISIGRSKVIKRSRPGRVHRTVSED